MNTTGLQTTAGSTWRLGRAADDTLAANVLTKQQTETLLVGMDFSSRFTGADGIDLVAIVQDQSSHDTLLTFGGSRTVTKQKTAVQFTVSAGTAGETHEVLVRVTTALGQVLEGRGWIDVL